MSEDLDLECPICLEKFFDIEKGDLINVPCCHKMFHINCLVECLIHKPNCPLCRNDLQLYHNQIDKKYIFLNNQVNSDVILYNNMNNLSYTMLNNDITNNNEIRIRIRNDFFKKIIFKSLFLGGFFYLLFKFSY